MGVDINIEDRNREKVLNVLKECVFVMARAGSEISICVNCSEEGENV